MLNNVEWGEYKIGEIFDTNNWVYGKNKQWKTRYDKNENNRYPVISGITINNGVNYYTADIPKDNEIFQDSLTISTRGEYSGTVTYHEGKFVLANNILVLNMPNLSKKQKLFIGTIINGLDYGGYDNYPRIETLKNDKIKLPIKNNKIYFDFMDKFITELENERIVNLKKYLLELELKDYTLTDEEQEFIGNTNEISKDINSLINNKLKKIEWCEYRIGDLFDRIKTNKLPYKAKELPSNAIGKYVLPCLTSSFMNQGLNYFVPKENATILKNVISIPSNSDVYRAYYQSKDFTVLSDAYAICWKDKEIKITPNQYLFMVLCINKVTDLPIYSYKNKLGGWNVVKNKHILLPQTNGIIDFDFMEKIINILKKLEIKDVVLYADEKSEITKIL